MALLVPEASVLCVLGLVVGSFLNVVIARMPVGASIVRPGSRCPSCGAPVLARDNIPVLSWLLLRGRCRACGVPIDVRYPLVEGATALLFPAAGLRFGGSPYLVVALVLVAAGVALFVIDREHRRLPFAITRVASGLAMLGLAADALVRGAGPLPVALASTVVWLVVYGGVWLVTSGRGMGLGDVALAPLLGLSLGWLGWGPSLVGLFAGFGIGAVVGAMLLASRRATRRSRVAHGPFLLVGTAVGLFAGQPLWTGYLRAVGIS
jgi:leader peptidase (prepilin peptidase)/N-methyltransferase